MEPKIILHLCADTGSDTKPYADDPDYKVIRVGSDIGVENYEPPENVHGIIANPPCTEFSLARSGGKARNPLEGMKLVKECLRIIEKANPKWWYLENPATGVLKKYLGEPTYHYQPWWYGSPWTKRTALWGKFNIPPVTYTDWEKVPKLDGLYIRGESKHRRSTGKPAMYQLHAKAHMKYIPEFEPFLKKITSKPSRVSSGVGADMEFRSLCSQKFAQAFKKVNP